MDGGLAQPAPASGGIWKRRTQRAPDRPLSASLAPAPGRQACFFPQLPSSSMSCNPGFVQSVRH
ncbi:hypothetical protein DAEQUDRAFT_732460 [Daedalea quercina L-15889]|uniref:Uncharacterized protein n=1 Tax=Daedalea quercina L-15889 TaxID=1314783 RepID=A0A165LM75_9APHY|nr:hypothetical protein DAEQUDRAFT_732460 [Daedalea quercina L-15889]